jgi:hypothetical protein
VGASTPPFFFKKEVRCFIAGWSLDLECWTCVQCLCKRRLADGSRPGEGYGMQNAIVAGINGSFGFYLSSESITKTLLPIALFPAIAFMSTKTILAAKTPWRDNDVEWLPAQFRREGRRRCGSRRTQSSCFAAGPLARRRCKGTVAHWEEGVEGFGGRTCVFFGRRSTMRAQMRSHLMCALRPASRAATSQQATRTKVVDPKSTTPPNGLDV